MNEVDQRNQWEKYLPLVEYAYNNTVHSSTSKNPFEIIEGKPKPPMLLKTKHNIFAANEYVRDIQDSFKKIKQFISALQQKQKRVVDKHKLPLEFKPDDWVLLRFSKARLRQTTRKYWQGEPTRHQKFYAKLAKRYYGPFQILERINETLYRLKLPSSWHIHNAFHVSFLKPYKGYPPLEPIEEDPPKFEEQEEIIQPEKILGGFTDM